MAKAACAACAAADYASGRSSKLNEDCEQLATYATLRYTLTNIGTHVQLEVQ